MPPLLRLHALMIIAVVALHGCGGGKRSKSKEEPAEHPPSSDDVVPRTGDQPDSDETPRPQPPLPLPIPNPPHHGDGGDEGDDSDDDGDEGDDGDAGDDVADGSGDEGDGGDDGGTGGPGPTASMNGAPTGYSSTTTLAVVVSGDGVVAYRAKVGVAATTDCTELADYGTERNVDVSLKDSIAALPDGLVRLCVIGRDATNNWQEMPSAAQWIKDVTPPVAGNAGELAFRGRNPDGFTVSWFVGNDGLGSSADKLAYRVCAANSPDDLQTEDQMHGPGCRELANYAVGLTTLKAKGLDPKTQYYVRVAVRDQAGNSGLSQIASVRTTPVVHLGYFNNTTKNLGYATNASGEFVPGSVSGACPADSMTLCGRNVSLRLDADNNPHLVYLRYNGVRNTLYHVHWQDGAWSVPAAISPNATATWNSLAIDDQGTLHLTFLETHFNTTSRYDLKYAKLVGEAWEIEPVYVTDVSGEYNSLALDKNGVPHVSFYRNSNADDLYVANRLSGLNAAGVWANSSAVDTNGVTGLYTSLALDAADRQHVTYHNATDGDLYYASNATGTWTKRVVDATNITGQYARIQVVTSGSKSTVHIVYYDATEMDLKHAVCTADAGVGKYCTDPDAEWRIQTITSTGNLGTWISFELDPSGYMHVGYYDASNSRILYSLGYFDETLRIWQFQDPVQVDNSAAIGSYSAIGIER